MPIARPLTNLTVFDILSNLVPGTLLLGIIGLIFAVEQMIPLGVVSAAVGALFGGYVAGHILQAAGSLLFSEYDVGDAIVAFSHDERSNEGNPFSSISLGPTFTHLIKQRFNLPANYTDQNMMNRLIMAELERSSASRALRFQILSYFYRNMSVVAICGVILSILSAGLFFCEISGTRHWLLTILLFITSIGTLPVFYIRMRQFNQRFVEYAIAEFYAIESDQKRPQFGG